MEEMPQNVIREKNTSICGDSSAYLLVWESGSCLRQPVWGMVKVIILSA